MFELPKKIWNVANCLSSQEKVFFSPLFVKCVCLCDILVDWTVGYASFVYVVRALISRLFTFSNQPHHLGSWRREREKFIFTMLFAVKMFQPISDFWTRHSDPGASRLPLLRGGPWEMMAITASYLYFVLYLGPRFMKHRKPYDLRFAMLLHNVLLVIFNCWLFSYGMWLSDWGKPIFECRPINLITASDHDRGKFSIDDK